ncbi:hypothetical protein KVT40_009251 [Elsinoe batatas]|uniref:Uncharacterized protein n=1 Tax=Elsinoe batatas TaxID=2601811 RepID=A0A8K0PEV4_9PEZI|nr:hypothetical protein KVT40_009251 [Elsinoe batatas]
MSHPGEWLYTHPAAQPSLSQGGSTLRYLVEHSIQTESNKIKDHPRPHVYHSEHHHRHTNGTNMAAASKMVNDTDKMVVGVKLQTLIDKPGTRLRWTENPESIKVLYATASEHQIVRGLNLTPSLINQIMNDLDLYFLETFEDVRGSTVFDNVARKIMAFYDYNMPRFVPFQMWTLDWIDAHWDGDTSKPKFGNVAIRTPVIRNSLEGVNKSAMLRDLLADAAELRGAEEMTDPMSTETPTKNVTAAEVIVDTAQVNASSKQAKGQSKKTTPKVLKKTAVGQPGEVNPTEPAASTLFTFMSAKQAGNRNVEEEEMVSSDAGSAGTESGVDVTDIETMETPPPRATMHAAFTMHGAIQDSDSDGAGETDVDSSPSEVEFIPRTTRSGGQRSGGQRSGGQRSGGQRSGGQRSTPAKATKQADKIKHAGTKAGLPTNEPLQRGLPTPEPEKEKPTKKPETTKATTKARKQRYTKGVGMDRVLLRK